MTTPRVSSPPSPPNLCMSWRNQADRCHVRDRTCRRRQFGHPAEEELCMLAIMPSVPPDGPGQ
jgi:hypothetical protein